MTETFAIPCVGALIRRVVNGQACVLLQERRKPNIGLEDGLLELPAGKLREYENVFDALRREIREETGLTLTHIVGESDMFRREVLGYDVQSFAPYCVTQNLSGGYSILLHTFLCEADGEAQAQPGETAAPRWVPLPELRRMLEHEPERFFPLHLGALTKYIREWTVKENSEAKRLWDAFQTLYPDDQLAGFISFLSQRGYSKMECIKALHEARGCGISEAKNLVHFSPAFAYRRATDEAFHDDLFAKLEQISGEFMTTPNLTAADQLRPRAAALIFNDQNQILLMLRRKNGKHYATLPGGGIEAGETPAEAAAREVLEEVNLTVTVGEQVLEMDNLHGSVHSHEHYFLTNSVSGEMRLGDGPEGIRQSEENHYKPQWVDVARLAEVNLVPEVLRDVVRGLVK